ncbi:hypothetical protein M5G07_10720 [Serratia symbiotica]|nr:hypothetical protein [Serratia symbiotica]
MHQAHNEKLFATNDAIAPVAKTQADRRLQFQAGARVPRADHSGSRCSCRHYGAGAAAVKYGADMLMVRGGGVTVGKAGGSVLGMLGRLKGLFGKGSAGVAEVVASAGKAASMLKLVPFLGPKPRWLTKARRIFS